MAVEPESERADVPEHAQPAVLATGVDNELDDVAKGEGAGLEAVGLVEGD